MPRKNSPKHGRGRDPSLISVNPAASAKTLKQSKTTDVDKSKETEKSKGREREASKSSKLGKQSKIKDAEGSKERERETSVLSNFAKQTKIKDSDKSKDTEKSQDDLATTENETRQVEDEKDGTFKESGATETNGERQLSGNEDAPLYGNSGPTESAPFIGGGEGGNYFGMYRAVTKSVVLLEPLEQAYHEFHPWRPKRQWFLTTGYYPDASGGLAKHPLKSHQLRLLNTPKIITGEDLWKTVPNANNVEVDPDGTAILNFPDEPTAQKSYDNSKLVKMGNHNLTWTNPKELYVVDLPEHKTVADAQNDFPTNVGMRIIQERGLKRVLIAKFEDEKAATEAFAQSPYKQIGDRVNVYEIEESVVLLTVPPGISVEDIKKRFPGGKEVEFSSPGQAKVIYEDNETSRKAYDESDLLKLGRPKLLWLKPEEVVMENIPNKLSASELKKKYFPNAKSVRFVSGDGGKRHAIFEFANTDERRNSAVKKNHLKDLKKVSSQRLGWNKGGGAKPDKNAQLKVWDVPKETTEEDLKNLFPSATNIRMQKGKAVLQFGSPEDALRAQNVSNMVKLGKNQLGFIAPHQLVVEEVPDKKSKIKTIKTDMPNLKKIRWVDGPELTKMAIVDFENAEARQKSYVKSGFKKLGSQTLRYVPAGSKSDIMEDTDYMEIAKTLWKGKHADFSNISNLFSVSIELIGVPDSTKALDLIKMFEDCKKCTFRTSGSKRVAVLDFDKPTAAAKGYMKAKNTKIGGKSIKVRVVPIDPKKV